MRSDAVEARQAHTPTRLDEAVRIIANLREEKADPRTIAQAFLDLDVRLRAAKPLEIASLVNPNPPDVSLADRGLAAVGTCRAARR